MLLSQALKALASGKTIVNQKGEVRKLHKGKLVDSNNDPIDMSEDTDWELHEDHEDQTRASVVKQAREAVQSMDEDTDVLLVYAVDKDHMCMIGGMRTGNLFQALENMLGVAFSQVECKGDRARMALHLVEKIADCVAGE